MASQRTNLLMSVLLLSGTLSSTRHPCQVECCVIVNALANPDKSLEPETVGQRPPGEWCQVPAARTDSVMNFMKLLKWKGRTKLAKMTRSSSSCLNRLLEWPRFILPYYGRNSLVRMHLYLVISMRTDYRQHVQQLSTRIRNETLPHGWLNLACLRALAR